MLFAILMIFINLGCLILFFYLFTLGTLDKNMLVMFFIILGVFGNYLSLYKVYKNILEKNAKKEKDKITIFTIDEINSAWTKSMRENKEALEIGKTLKSSEINIVLRVYLMDLEKHFEDENFSSNQMNQCFNLLNHLISKDSTFEEVVDVVWEIRNILNLRDKYFQFYFSKKQLIENKDRVKELDDYYLS